ncbi:MAG: cation:proton antiporter [Sandaracinaceae bacterium]|nr:cation:proton antiporter [Sandaracinaceae bacterium]
MAHVPYLDELAIIAVTAVIVTVLLGRLKLPTVAGLLCSGVLIGPAAIGLVKSSETIEALAEIGVVLLLFTIGLEFPARRLIETFRRVAIGGALQVGGTMGVTVAVAMMTGESPSRAVFYGFVVALSSTAIVLRALTDRQELDAPHGRVVVGTLIFQDLCVVPMVLIVPLLGDHNQGSAVVGISIALGKAVLVVAGTLLVARVVVPHVLKLVDASRSREVFLLAVLGLCIGIAWLTAVSGLSLALGAFLAGVIVADTEYGHRAMGDMLPLRDVFLSVFFVSLGMLFDVRVVVARPGAVFLMLAMFLIVKGVIASLAALATRMPARVAWLTGVGLAQFGEFGFVLARLGEKSGVVTPEDTAPLLAAGILSMIITPILIRVAPRFRGGVKLLTALERKGTTHVADAKSDGPLDQHIVIVGFGIAGKFAARALGAAGFRYVVLELNSETVRVARETGEPIYYGDATSTDTLHHLKLESARALVILMNDPEALKRVIVTAKRMAANVPILIRTRYLAHKDELLRLGATDVVAEEVEAGVEVISRLMQWLDVPQSEIDQKVIELRSASAPTAS